MKPLYITDHLTIELANIFDILICLESAFPLHKSNVLIFPSVKLSVTSNNLFEIGIMVHILQQG